MAAQQLIIQLHKHTFEVEAILGYQSSATIGTCLPLYLQICTAALSHRCLLAAATNPSDPAGPGTFKPLLMCTSNSCMHERATHGTAAALRWGLKTQSTAICILQAPTVVRMVCRTPASMRTQPIPLHAGDVSACLIAACFW